MVILGMLGDRLKAFRIHAIRFLCVLKRLFIENVWALQVVAVAFTSSFHFQMAVVHLQSERQTKLYP